MAEDPNLEAEVIETVINLTTKAAKNGGSSVIISQDEKLTDEFDDCQSNLIIVDDSSNNCSATNSPAPFSSTIDVSKSNTLIELSNEPELEEEKKSDCIIIDNKDGETVSVSDFDSQSAYKVKQSTQSEQSSSLQQTIKNDKLTKNVQPPILSLMKLPIQPSPVQKILPRKPKILCSSKKDSGISISKEAQTRPAAEQVQNPTSKTNLLTKECINAPKRISLPVFTHTIKGISASNTTMTQLKQKFNKIQPANEFGQINRPTEIPIKPKSSINMPANSTTLASISASKIVSSSQVDLLANTVNKVAAGVEISPNEQDKDKTTKTATKPKAKKKVQQTKLVSEEEGKTKGPTSTTMTTQSHNLIPITGNVQPFAGANTVPSKMLFPNQQFTLASNGNLVAVSNGGLTYVIRQQQPNVNEQQQYIPFVRSHQVFLSPMQQLGKNQLTDHADGQCESQNVSNYNPHLLQGNVFIRSGDMIMPVSHTSHSDVPSQAQKQFIISPENQPKFIQPKQMVNIVQKGSKLETVERKNYMQPQPQKIASVISSSSGQLYFAPSGIQQGRLIQLSSDQSQIKFNGINKTQSDMVSETFVAVNQPNLNKSRRKRKEDSNPDPPNLKQMYANISREEIDEEENEPPPVLCRDESSATQSIETIFQKEAKIIREKMFDATGKKIGPLKHFIDGFEIEEDVEPFPCKHKKLLNKLRTEEGSKVADELETSIESINKDLISSEIKEANFCDNVRLRRKRVYSSSSDNSSSSRSPKDTKSIRQTSSSKSSKKATKKGRHRELEGLLKMDFGPGKTPFQTFDPEEYAEEVMTEARQQQKTLALAAEERSRRSAERSESSSSKNRREKDKQQKISSPSPDYHIVTSNTSNQVKIKSDKEALKNNGERMETNKQQELKLIRKRSELERSGDKRSYEHDAEEDHCLHCNKSFKEVGRDKDHIQYCSKGCRKQRKQIKKLKSNSVESSLTALGEDSGNNPIPIRRSDPILSESSSDAPNTSQKMTSPLGSAFASLQPQMLSTNFGRPSPMAGSSTKRKYNVDDQAAYLMTHNQQQQMGTRFPAVAAGLDIYRGSVANSPTREQMFVTNMKHLPIPTAIHPQQHIIYPQVGPYFNPQTSSGEGLHQFYTTQHQQIPSQIAGTHFLAPSSTSFMQQLQQQQSAPVASSSQLMTVSPPTAPTTPLTSLEKNSEMETLIARDVQSWTPNEVAKWVNYITKSEKNGEKFILQEIDGASLILLTQEQLKDELDLRLGPAVKLISALNALRTINTHTHY